MTRTRTLWLAALVGLAVMHTAASAREPTDKRDASALARQIDQTIDARLAEAKVQAAAPASDAEFLRRVYLDLHGTIPPVDRVITFLEGGYDLAALEQSTAACLVALAGDESAGVEVSGEAPTGGGPGRDVVTAAGLVQARLADFG